MLVDPPVVDPSGAVPAGRIPYAAARPKCVLHSFIAPAAWVELSVEGRLRARREHALHDPIDLFAYRWIATQVRERLGASEDAWPLWAWARTRRCDLVSSARRYAELEPGTVLITMHVDEHRVLRSGFSDWHAPLNALPVLPRDLDEDAYDRALDAWWRKQDERLAGDRSLRPEHWPADLRSELTASWPDVFDASRWSRRDAVQACLAEVRAEDVVDAVRLGHVATDAAVRDFSGRPDVICTETRRRLPRWAPWGSNPQPAD